MYCGQQNSHLISILVVFLVVQNAWSQYMDRETAASRLCHIENGLIHCDYVPLKTQNVTVLGNVHACTNPVYVQFVIGLMNSPQKSKYTFINSDETKTIRGLSDHVRLHVILQHIDDYIFLKASFLQQDLEGYQEIFLETHLDMPDGALCANSDSSTDRVLPIVIVAVAAVMIATAATLLLYCWHKKRRRAKRAATELLADMEGSPSTIPYQEEAVSANFSGPKPSTTTVIQNSLYRDSLALDDSGLDTIAEEGDDGTGSTRGHKQRRRPRKRPSHSAPSSRSHRQADLVDTSQADTSSPHSQGGDLLQQGNSGRSQPAEGPVIAKIAPPPLINCSPAVSAGRVREPGNLSN